MRAYKTELDPNNVQTSALRQHCGARRWAYNWGLERIKSAADSGAPWPSAIDLHRQLNAIKGTDELPWGYAVSKCAFQEALRDLDAALKNWRSSKTGERAGPKMEFPKRKTRKRGLGTCRFTGTIKVFDGQVQLPRLGRLRLKEQDYIPDGQYAQATISEQAGRWFVSVVTRAEKVKPPLTETVVGIDVGIKTLAVCSDGTTFVNPRALAAKSKQLRRWQRIMARRQKGSQNRAKARRRVARLYKQVADVRRDAHNKAAHAIVAQRPAVIVLEDLNVKGMVRNHRLANALSDVALGQFGRIVTYMAEDAGIQVVKAGRFFASSKTCSGCGWRKEDLTLADRTFVCQACGLVLDRDLNAALNLRNTVSSTGINACGDWVRPTSNGQAPIAEAGTLSQMSLNGMFV
jgi:putative transposase